MDANASGSILEAQHRLLLSLLILKNKNETL